MRFFNIVLCVSWWISGLALSIYLASIPDFPFWGITGMAVTYFIVFAFLMFLLLLPFAKNGNIHPFWLSGFIMIFGNIKKVYHEHLGVFYMDYTASSNQCSLYKVKLLGAKEVFGFNYNNNIDVMAHDIKSKLDKEYSEKLKAINNESEALKKLKEWDGYLDKATRRDRKIKQIIK